LWTLYPTTPPAKIEASFILPIRREMLRKLPSYEQVAAATDEGKVAYATMARESCSVSGVAAKVCVR